MVQVSAWAIFIVGVLVGMMIGSLAVIIFALTYKGNERKDKNGNKKEK